MDFFVVLLCNLVYVEGFMAWVVCGVVKLRWRIVVKLLINGMPMGDSTKRLINRYWVKLSRCLNEIKTKG